MSRHTLMKGASACALLLSLSAIAEAQQSLPAIDVGGARRSTGAQKSRTSNAGAARQGTSLPILASTNGAGGSGSGSAPLNSATGHLFFPAEDNSTYHPENTSTAMRTNTPIMQTPVSVQVVPRAVINDRQSVQISDAVNTVSGVIATDNFQAGQESYWIRGFYTNNYYLDGVRLNTVYTSTFQNTANIDRIEVLKGPASILYGKGDPGGIINVLMKQPQSTQKTTIQQQFGSWSFYRTTLDSTGPITKDGSLLYRMIVNYENQKNFAVNSGGRNVFVAPTLQWNIDDHTFFNVFLTYNDRVYRPQVNTRPFVGLGPNSWNNNPLYGWVFGTGMAPASLLPRSSNVFQPWSNNATTDLQTGYTFSRDLNENWNLRQQGFVQLSTQTILQQGPTNYNDSYGIPLAMDQYAQGTPGGGVGQRNYYYYGSADLTGKFSTGIAEHTLLSGVQLTHFNQAATVTSYGGAIQPFSALAPVYSQYPTYNINLVSTSCSDPNYFNSGLNNFTACSVPYGFVENLVGAYVQDQIKLPQNIIVMAGARLDQTQFSDPVNKTTITNTSKVSPRFGLLWQPIPEVSVYSNYLTGLGPSPFVTKPGELVKPETAEQWEVGVKTEFLDKKLSAQVAYYDLTKQNIARPDPADPTGLRQVVVGEARNKGFELDVSGQILPGWKIIAGYSYIASIITKDSACVDPENFGIGCVFDAYSGVLIGLNGLEGKRLGGVPRHSGSLWSTYEIQEGDLKGLKFGGGVTARSLMQGNDQNTFHIPGWGRLDLMTSYDTKVFDTSLTFQLNVNNVLDTRYYQLGYPSIGNTQTGTPRNFRGSILAKF
jgi:iron complex outermembrane recepter protein